MAPYNVSWQAGSCKIKHQFYSNSKWKIIIYIVHSNNNNNNNNDNNNDNDNNNNNTRNA